MKQRFATTTGGGSPSAVFFRWLGWMLALNVAWEIAQMPLYTLPPAPFPFYTAYSIAHCSVGDMLIASAVYLRRSGSPPVGAGPIPINSFLPPLAFRAQPETSGS